MSTTASTQTSTGTPTSYIPLTTIFSPPTNCASSWTYEPSEYNANPSGLFVQNAVGGASFDAGCWPPNFIKWGRGEVAGGTVQIFSPGWCPDGYSTTRLEPGATTTAVCCPTSFFYTVSAASAEEKAAGTLVGCISTFSAGTSTTVRARPLGTTLSYDAIVTSTLDGVKLGEVTMWAQPITVAFQERDISLFSNTSTADLSSADSASSAISLIGSVFTPSPTLPAIPTSYTSSDSESSGLSTGAKAGIGVGVALGFLALLACALCLLFRRRKRQRVVQNAHGYKVPVNLPPQEMNSERPRAEMSHESKAQLDSPHEMP